MTADTKPPFRFWSFFFSPQGRVSRLAIWYFVLPLQAALLAGVYGIGFIKRYLLTPDQVFHSGWLYTNVWIGLLMLITLWPLFAVMVKRLHDVNMTGLAAAPLFLPLVLAVAIVITSAVLARQGAMSPAMWWRNAIGLGRNAADFYVFALAIFLALRKGQRGANRFGADPTGYTVEAVF